NFESEKSYMAGITITAPESWGVMSGSSLTAGVIDHAGAAGNLPHLFNFYAGGTFKTGVEGLLVGASFDYVGSEATTTVGSFYANAIAGYVSFQVDKAKFSVRGEYASGTSSAGPFANGGKAAAGSNTELFGVTGTVEYKLWENVISRLELRWDSDVS